MSRKKITKGKNKKYPGVPSQKISEALSEFISPHMIVADENATKEDVEALFKVAVTIWNAVTFEQLGRGDDFVRQIRETIRGDENSDLTILNDGLIQRKRELFAHDLRLIGHHEIVMTGPGEFTVRAEAHLADSLLNAH